MEKALSKKKVNLQTIPPEVALNIAQTMGSWKEENQKRDAPKERPYWLRGPTEGEKRKALLSLSKLSRASNKLWTNLLLQDVELELDHLPSFIALLKKAPNVGQLVQRLRFTLTMKEEEEQDDPFGSWNLGGGFTRQMDTWLDAENGRICEKLISLDESFDHQLLNSETGSRSAFLNQVSIARGLILDALPNLQSLEVVGNLAFPFCKLNFGDIKPLAAFVNLKEIKIVRNQWEMGNHLSGRNVIWILMLPNLVKANLAPLIDKTDLKYFNLHQSTLKTGLSQVKNLTLTLEYTRKFPREDWDVCSAGIISSCKRLERLRVTVDEPERPPVNQSEVKSRSPFEGVLQSLPNLKELIGDVNLIDWLLSMVTPPAHDSSELKQIFHSNLKSFRLCANTFVERHLTFSGRVGQISDNFLLLRLLPEYQLGQLLKKIIAPKSLKVITYKFQVGLLLIIQRDVLEFKKGRALFRKACSELGIEPEFWQDVLKEDQVVLHPGLNNGR